jgi:hypothetical protein
VGWDRARCLLAFKLASFFQQEYNYSTRALTSRQAAPKMQNPTHPANPHPAPLHTQASIHPINTFSHPFTGHKRTAAGFEICNILNPQACDLWILSPNCPLLCCLLLQTVHDRLPRVVTVRENARCQVCCQGNLEGVFRGCGHRCRGWALILNMQPSAAYNVLHAVPAVFSLSSLLSSSCISTVSYHNTRTHMQSWPWGRHDWLHSTLYLSAAACRPVL